MSGTREGVIIKWSLKRQFHDVEIDVLMSRMAVRELDDDDDCSIKTDETT